MNVLHILLLLKEKVFRVTPLLSDPNQTLNPAIHITQPDFIMYIVHGIDKNRLLLTLNMPD